MPTVGTLEFVLQGCGLSKPNVALVMDHVADLDEFEDLLHSYTENRSGLQAEFRSRLESIDKKTFRSNDTAKLLYVFDWFFAHFDKPGFAWDSFNRADFINFKRECSKKIMQNKLKAATTATNTDPDTLDTNTAATDPALTTVDIPDTATTTSTISAHANYTNKTLKKDADGISLRASGGKPSDLKPHPLWVSPYLHTARSNVNTKLFHDSDISLPSDQAKDIIDFYRHLCVIAKSAEIDLCPISHFDPTFGLWPKNRKSEIVFAMNDILAIKLSQPDTLNLQNPTLQLLYQTYMQKSDSQLNAYTFLHQLLKRASHKLKRSMPIPPSLPQSDSITDFGTQLIKYFTAMENIGSAIAPRTQSEFLLAHMREHNVDVDIFHSRLQQLTITDPLPDDLHATDLILQLADTRQYSPHTPLIHRLHHKQNPSQRHSRPSRPPIKPQPRLSNKPFHTTNSSQCEACHTWGHTAQNCRFLAQFLACKQYALQHDNTCLSISQRWQQSNDKTIKQAVIRQLIQLHPEEYSHRTEEDILESLSDENDSHFL